MNSRRVFQLLLLLGMFFLIGATYVLVIPSFESHDEWSHVSLVRYWQSHWRLPPRVLPPGPALTGPDVAWFLQYHEPPLYYAPPLYHSLAALLTFWADMDDLPDLLLPSPSWEAGWVPQPDGTPENKNLFVHPATATWAQSGTVRTVIVLRFVSLGLGVVTVLCSYGMVRLLWPDRPVMALGAAVLVATNPQFIGVSATVNNDNLFNALCSLFLLGALHWMQGGVSWRRWALLGGLVGLGLLTKQTALLLLPLGLLAVIWQCEKTVSMTRKLLLDGGSFLCTALLVGGWWYVRNGLLYGDPLGLEPHFASQVPLTCFGLPEMWMAVRSYWAAFGWAPILVEPGIYVVVGLAALAGVAGVAVSVRPGGAFHRLSATTRRGLLFLALAWGLNGLSFSRWAVETGSPIGRLLFPTLTAVAVWLAWGLSQWRRWPVVRWILGITAGLALLFAALVPWRYLYPAYASPYLSKGMPDSAQTVGATFQGGIQLAGYKETVQDLEPGGTLDLTLYWVAQAAPDRQVRVWVQLGPQDPALKVAEQDTWLGGTLYPSEFWRAGDTVRQVHRLSIPEWADAPGLYWVRVGLVDDAGERVILQDRDSDHVLLGPWRMDVRSTPPEPSRATDFRLDGIRLLGYDLEQQGLSLYLTLFWEAEQIPAVDYVIFAHVWGADGNLVGQQDGPPREGRYPTTWWLPGQVVVDRHVIDLDEGYSGPVSLQVGMYDAETMLRLPVVDGSGQRLPEAVIPLGILE